MKLSFVIPAYNEEGFIGKCLGSITRELSGGNHDAEIIVVNNASTDGTRTVAEAFSGVRVVDEPRKGLTNARQAGLRAASGDLIANVDADSVLTPGWVDTVFHEFTKNQKLVALSGPFIYYDLPLLTNIFVRVWYYIGFLSYIVNRYILRISSMLQGGNFVVRKDALLQIGGFDTHIHFYGEDTDMARRLDKIGPVKFTFSLPMYSSGRRIRKEGLLTMGVRYGLNYLWGVLFHRPFTKTHINVRAPGKEIEKTTVKNVRYGMLVLHILSGAVLLAAASGVGYVYTRPHEVDAFSFDRIKRKTLAEVYDLKHHLYDDNDFSFDAHDFFDGGTHAR